MNTNNTKLTLANVRAELAALGMTIAKKDGEYRVTSKLVNRERAEAIAYYTNELDDALSTGKHIAGEIAKTNDPTPHFFATSAFTWAKGKTREEAIAKVARLAGLSIIKAQVKASKGMYVWSCQVNLPMSSQYRVNEFMPVVGRGEWQDSQEALVINIAGDTIPTKIGSNIANDAAAAKPTTVDKSNNVFEALLNLHAAMHDVDEAAAQFFADGLGLSGNETEDVVVSRWMATNGGPKCPVSFMSLDDAFTEYEAGQVAKAQAEDIAAANQKQGDAEFERTMSESGDME